MLRALNGLLRLRAVVGAGGRTVLADARAEFPLQVGRPRACTDDGRIELVVLLQSGGLLDGDSARIEVEVEAGARMALRTQAATQVHAGRSEQTLDARVGRGGVFSYVPHSIVPHAWADFAAEARLELEDGARALVAEVVSPGRVDFGEAFAYARVRIAFDARIGGVLVARERALLEPSADMRFPQFGVFTHVATAYSLGATEPPDCGLEKSELAHGGWFARGLAHRAADLDAALSAMSEAFWNSGG